MISYTFKEDYIIEVTYDYSPMRKNVFSETKVEELEGRELDTAIREKAKRLEMKSYHRPELTKEEKFVEKTRDYKTLFKKGDEIVLNKGVNILVGDNGCGKSTLIRLLLKKAGKLGRVLHIDLERENPNVNTPPPEHGLTYTMPEIMNKFMWSVESHGETREGVLKSILTLDFDLLILDEPEQGLSLKNQKKYFNELKDLGKDVIIVTHSKVFIEETEEIFDVETMKWVNSKEYLKNI